MTKLAEAEEQRSDDHQEQLIKRSMNCQYGAKENTKRIEKER